MTREEAISRLKEGEPFSEIYNSVWEEALDMAIKALEQEPCEDWISKKAVMQVLTELGYGDEENGAEPEYMSALVDVAKEVKAIKALESKTGHWVERHEPFTWMGYTDYVCSVCGKETKIRTNFCPDCGTKMTESVGKE